MGFKVEQVGADKNESLINMGVADVKMSLDLIDSDIKAIECMVKTIKGRENLKNTKALLDYLKDLRETLDDEGRYQVNLVKSSYGYLETYPIRLYANNRYKVYARNYIELEPCQHMIVLDFTKLANLITFDMAFEDLGYNKNEIDGILDENSARICATNSVDVLGELYQEDLYEASRWCKCDRPVYWDLEHKKMTDYFGEKVFNTDRYNKALDYSVHRAVESILVGFLDTLGDKKEQLKIVGMDFNSVVLIADNWEENDLLLVGEYFNQVTVRCYGLTFSGVPDIAIR